MIKSIHTMVVVEPNRLETFGCSSFKCKFILNIPYFLLPSIVSVYLQMRWQPSSETLLIKFHGESDT